MYASGLRIEIILSSLDLGLACTLLIQSHYYSMKWDKENQSQGKKTDFFPPSRGELAYGSLVDFHEVVEVIGGDGGGQITVSCIRENYSKDAGYKTKEI